MNDQSLNASRPPLGQGDKPAEAANEPVWRYVDDAIYISYVVEHYPASQPSSFAVVFKHLMEQRYGAAPVPRSDRRINMGSLRTQDFRAQCALVRHVVEEPDNRAGISSVQRNAVLARFAYQAKRVTGVLGLYEHFAGMCATRNPTALKALLWGWYELSSRSRSKVLKAARGDWSMKAIERECGVPRAVLSEDRKLIDGHLHNIERTALLVLEAYFQKTGLVGEFD